MVLVLAGRVLARRPSRKSEGRVFLRCSTAWCISSHEVVYFGVRPGFLARARCDVDGRLTEGRYSTYCISSC